jgi:hypothetical protein
MRNREYFLIFWAIENQSVIGELPEGVVEEIARLWEKCVQVVAEIVEAGVASAEFRACDPWEVANILWTLANGLIQSEGSTTRKRLRRQPLARAFDDAIELVLRGLGTPAADRNA